MFSKNLNFPSSRFDNVQDEILFSIWVNFISSNNCKERVSLVFIYTLLSLVL